MHIQNKQEAHVPIHVRLSHLYPTTFHGNRGCQNNQEISKSEEIKTKEKGYFSFDLMFLIKCIDDIGKIVSRNFYIL